MGPGIEYASIVLIDFNMLVDTDYGVIRLINKEYCDRSVFFKSITSSDPNHLRGTLHDRTMFNPLQVAFRDESEVEMMDSYYQQFMSLCYEKIVDLSSPTTLIDVAKTFIRTNGVIKCTFLCRNYYERKILKDLIFKEFPSTSYNIILNTTDSFDVSAYSDIFVKDIRTLTRFKNCRGKNIYVADLICNMNTELYKEKGIEAAPEAYLQSFFLVNELRYIEMYNYDDSYFEEGYAVDKKNSSDIEVDSSIMKNNIFVKSMLGNIPESYADDHKQDEYVESKDPYIQNNREDGKEEDDFDPSEIFNIINAYKGDQKDGRKEV